MLCKGSRGTIDLVGSDDGQQAVVVVGGADEVPMLWYMTGPPNVMTGKACHVKNGAPTEAQLLVAVAGRGYGGVHALVPLGAVEL